MEKIKRINEILKKHFYIDIFDGNMQKQYILEKYFTIDITFEELLKSIYGENVEIIVESNVIDSIPSKIEKIIDLKKSNNELVLSLDDLGYENINIKYYIKEKNKKIYLGSYKNKIKKYAQPCTKIGFMNKIEKIYNITLLPNIDYTELIYEKEQVLPDGYNDLTASIPGYFVPADFNHYKNVLKKANSYTAVKTNDGNTICKDIECNHKNGYSTEEHLPTNVNIKYNYLNNEIFSNLCNVPNSIKEQLINKLDLLIKSKEEVIINIIITILKEILNKRIIYIDEKFFKDSYCNIPKILSYNYDEIIKYCTALNVSIPIIEQKNLEAFIDFLNQEKQKKMHEYNEKISAICNKIEQEKKYINNNDKILKKAEKYIKNVYYSIDPLGYEIKGITESLYCEFRDILLQKNNSINKLKEMILNVKEGINIIENLPSYKLHDGDYDIIDEEYLSHNFSKVLVEFIEKNIDYCKKHIKFTPTNDILIYSYKEEQENMITQYDYLILIIKEIIKQLNDYSTEKEILSSFITGFEKINLVYGKKLIEENLYDTINNKKELLENLSNGNLLNKNVITHPCNKLTLSKKV